LYAYEITTLTATLPFCDDQYQKIWKKLQNYTDKTSKIGTNAVQLYSQSLISEECFVCLAGMSKDSLPLPNASNIPLAGTHHVGSQWWNG